PAAADPAGRRNAARHPCQRAHRPDRTTGATVTDPTGPNTPGSDLMPADLVPGDVMPGNMMPADMRPPLPPAETAERCAAVLAELERAIIGQRAGLELVLTGILAGSHILLEDLPGLGKTLTARSFARVLGLDFTRIQFTPDLLPSDVVGAPLYDQRSGEMVFRPGPVFTQLLLADEINRTPPKTQAALLEAMGEGQVSMDGVTRRLP